MKVFTLVSLMLMPPTLIASFFGMNVRFGLFFEHSGWSWFIIVLMMLASFYVIFRIFKSRNMF
jgi:magnesium transporter